MKAISTFLALMNSLMAGVIIVFSFSPSELGQASSAWLVTRVGAALAVITVSLLTWLANGRRVQPTLLSLGSLFLVALGAAAAVWTVDLAIVSGDMEFYMIAYGASLIFQGATALFAGQSRHIAAS